MSGATTKYCNIPSFRLGWMQHLLSRWSVTTDASCELLSNKHPIDNTSTWCARPYWNNHNRNANGFLFIFVPHTHAITGPAAAAGATLLSIPSISWTTNETCKKKREAHNVHMLCHTHTKRIQLLPPPPHPPATVSFGHPCRRCGGYGVVIPMMLVPPASATFATTSTTMDGQQRRGSRACPGCRSRSRRIYTAATATRTRRPCSESPSTAGLSPRYVPK